ncbi:MerR family transcriptional regulator [Sporomusa acidovorans]|uniref:HTH-type transcriptional regulator HmrR n=1 Tax=Sporomusa acidovorans (strain ATCC 49682 / DSM 3132 / Mol) TaxID=1123286 RepID=A0ABZ3J158_SPOA4|nr:MerR family transcriptional regulator [Sporomusa acidovorans]OZC15106.1 HTH-type transcriptional regulator HmrR [Sporomusa acidovorans DSM 3132]SDF86435.1 transcriptional regulator, MerR family [Sporomusa acidovorans]
MDEKLFSIGQVAKSFGIHTSTLRYYEEVGVLKPAVRRSGRRYYGMPELERLTLIQMLQSNDLSLNEIFHLLTYPTELINWREVLNEHIAKLEKQIRSAVAAKSYLEYLLTCPSKNVFDGCPYLYREIQRRLATHIPD